MVLNPVALDDQVEYYRILWYGDPGKGKTSNIAAAAIRAEAAGGKVIYIDADNGVKKKALARLGIPTSVIEIYRDVSYRGIEELHEVVGNRLADGDNIYAVCWDTTTKTASEQLETISIEAYKANERKPAAARKPRGEHDIWQDDYGVLANQMRKLLRRFHKLDTHLLIGAHMRKDKDDETGKITVGPAMSPAIVTDFGGYMDCIIHCRTETFDIEDPLLTEGEEFTGLTRPVGRFMAKDRFGLLPKVMVNPNADRVFSYLDGDLVKGDDPWQKGAIKRRQGQAKVDEAKAKEAAEEADDSEGGDEATEGGND